MTAIIASCNDLICGVVSLFVIFAGFLFIMVFVGTERKP